MKATISVVFVILLGALAACGDEDSGPPKVKPPPPATLVTASGMQTGGMRNYCWREGEKGLCVDAIGWMLPEEPILAQAGQPITLQLQVEPTELSLLAWALEDGNVVPDTVDGFFAWRPEAEPILREHPPAQSSFQFTPSLPPGQYVIELGVSAAPGSVGYDFLLELVP